MKDTFKLGLLFLGALALSLTLATAEGKCGDSQKGMMNNDGKCGDSQRSMKCDDGKRSMKCDDGKRGMKRNDGRCGADGKRMKETKPAPTKGKCGKGKCG